MCPKVSDSLVGESRIGEKNQPYPGRVLKKNPSIKIYIFIFAWNFFLIGILTLTGTKDENDEEKITFDFFSLIFKVLLL